MSEAFIFASPNPQYDNRLFIELQVQYMKVPSSEHGENMLCTKIVLNVKNNFCTQHVLPMFELGIFMYWTCNSMNNLSSYCGLVDAKIRASDKDLPVLLSVIMLKMFHQYLLKTKVQENKNAPTERISPHCGGTNTFYNGSCPNCLWSPHKRNLIAKVRDWSNVFRQTTHIKLHLLLRLVSCVNEYKIIAL